MVMGEERSVLGHSTMDLILFPPCVDNVCMKFLEEAIHQHKRGYHPYDGDSQLCISRPYMDALEVLIQYLVGIRDGIEGNRFRFHPSTIELLFH